LRKLRKLLANGCARLRIVRQQNDRERDPFVEYVDSICSSRSIDAVQSSGTIGGRLRRYVRAYVMIEVTNPSSSAAVCTIRKLRARSLSVAQRKVQIKYERRCGRGYV